MSDYSRFVAWQAGCRNAPGKSHRMPSDEFHQGNCGGYSQAMYCPNGLPIDRGIPSESPAWRERVEKAKRDIATQSDAIEWQQIAESVAVVFTAEDVSGLVELTKGVWNDD